MRTRASGVCYALAAGLSLGAAIATSNGAIILNDGEQVNLQTLLDSQDRAFIVGDKIFTISSYTSSDFVASNIQLIGYENQFDPLSGRGFDITGGFADVPGNTEVAEFNLQYTVEVLPEFYAQGFRIKDATLAFNGATSDTPGTFARVDESLFELDSPSGMNLVGQTSVFSRWTDQREEQLQDFLQFDPLRGLRVNKDVKLFAPGQGDSTSISFVRQSFSQIPTPGTVVLAGLAGLVGMRRRR